MSPYLNWVWDGGDFRYHEFVCQTYTLCSIYWEYEDRHPLQIKDQSERDFPYFTDAIKEGLSFYSIDNEKDRLGK